MIGNSFSANSIRLARVTHVHPEGQKMEVIFLDTGDFGRDVELMTPYGGTDFGLTTGVPAPDEEGHAYNTEEWDPNKRHINAVVASVQCVNICLMAPELYSGLKGNLESAPSIKSKATTSTAGKRFCSTSKCSVAKANSSTSSGPTSFSSTSSKTNPST